MKIFENLGRNYDDAIILHDGPVCKKKDCQFYGNWKFGLIPKRTMEMRGKRFAFRAFMCPKNPAMKYEAQITTMMWCHICKHSTVDLYVKQ